jgi:hypothetical protein
MPSIAALHLRFQPLRIDGQADIHHDDDLRHPRPGVGVRHDAVDGGRPAVDLHERADARLVLGVQRDPLRRTGRHGTAPMADLAQLGEHRLEPRVLDERHPERQRVLAHHLRDAIGHQLLDGARVR